MNDLNYYIWATYRRYFLDILQEKYKFLYKGTVLDIGGRDRGLFVKPRKNVDKWIFADINEEYNPDIVLDVTNMSQIDSNSIDVINAIELFEHVQDIEKGLIECYRVLKKDGALIIAVPFLSHIHADPFDFQRWTSTKWKLELKEIGFKIEKLIIMGKFFTHQAEMLKLMLKSEKGVFPRFRKMILTIIYPLLNKMSLLDNSSFVRKNEALNNYHNGYFIIVRK